LINSGLFRNIPSHYTSAVVNGVTREGSRCK
jgi:hypothetical protein